MSATDPDEYDNKRPEEEKSSTSQNVMYWAITTACATYVYDVFVN